MNLTERYIQLFKELADLGYDWSPRAGDWILDITDESIGMLTTYIEKPELIRKVNVQIPYGEQIHELLDRRGCKRDGDEQSIYWVDHTGKELHRCSMSDYECNDDEHALAALVEDFYKHGP